MATASTSLTVRALSSDATSFKESVRGSTMWSSTARPRRCETNSVDTSNGSGSKKKAPSKCKASQKRVNRIPAMGSGYFFAKIKGVPEGRLLNKNRHNKLRLFKLGGGRASGQCFFTAPALVFDCDFRPCPFCTAVQSSCQVRTTSLGDFHDGTIRHFFLFSITGKNPSKPLHDVHNNPLMLSVV